MRLLSLAIAVGFLVSLSAAARADCRSEEAQIRQLLQRQTQQLTGDSICHTARDAERVFREVLAFYERCSINDPGGEMRRSMRESIDWATQTQSSVCVEEGRATSAAVDPRLAEFAMADTERSRAINEQRLDAEGQRSTVSAAAMDHLVQQQMSSALQMARQREQLRAVRLEQERAAARLSQAFDSRTVAFADDPTPHESYVQQQSAVQESAVRAPSTPSCGVGIGHCEVSRSGP